MKLRRKRLAEGLKNVRRKQGDIMRYIWKDYEPEKMDFVEAWLDKHAVRMTGMEEGYRSEYEYWAGEEEHIVGENFWSKVVYENENPFSLVQFGLYEGVVTIMETIVAPGKRGKGLGSGVIKELLQNSKSVIGFDIEKAEAVIFPSNIASKKAFEKAGFYFSHAHEDGDALYYIYEKEILFGMNDISELNEIPQTHEIRCIGINERRVFNKHLRLCKPKNKRLFFRGASQSDWKKWYNENTEYYLLFVDDKPVSRCAIEKYSSDAWEAADVKTAPEYRNRGYSKEIVAYVTKKILEQGKTATCRTQKNNLPMLKVMETIGYKKLQ